MAFRPRLAGIWTYVGWIIIPSGVVFLGTMTACIAPLDAASTDGAVRAADEENTGFSAQAIVGGTLDRGPQETGAVVALSIGGGARCTGTLVAPDVVLTARHCVSSIVARVVRCDERGETPDGAHFADDLPPESIHIYAGAQPRFAGPSTAVGKRVVHGSGATLCNSDIALIVLDRPIAGVTPLKVRLQRGVVAGETVRSVGYGKDGNDEAMDTRRRRAGVAVRAVGARVSASGTPLASREFEVGQSFCGGDSGGPAISERTGAIVGVVSRGGDCQATFGQVYTSTHGFDALFAEVSRLSGAAVEQEEDTAEPSSAAGADAEEPPDGTTPVRTRATTFQDTAAAQGCTVRGPGFRADPTSGSAGAAPSGDPRGMAAIVLALAASVCRRRRAAHG